MDTQNEPLARVSNEFLDYQYQVLGIGDHMHSSDVTEICINRPGELYLERPGRLAEGGRADADVRAARQFCTSVVNESNTGQRITDIDPMVSLTFPTGQRAQFVIPPACDAGKVSITIRLPAKFSKSLEQYEQDGFFDEILEQQQVLVITTRTAGAARSRNYAEFFRKAVQYHKNIVVAARPVAARPPS